MSVKVEFENLFEALKTERDEVIVKSHLASMAVKDELAEFEKKWQSLKLKAASIADSSKETSEDFIARAKQECEELSVSYHRLGPYVSEKTTFAEDELGLLYDKLKTERDEVIVKLHLASMEAKEEFVGAEEKWDILKIKISDIADDTKETSEELVASAKIITEELKDTYHRIMRRLSH